MSKREPTAERAGEVRDALNAASSSLLHAAMALRTALDWADGDFEGLAEPVRDAVGGVRVLQHEVITRLHEWDGYAAARSR